MTQICPVKYLPGFLNGKECSTKILIYLFLFFLITILIHFTVIYEKFSYDHKFLNDLFNINSMVNKQQKSEKIIDNIGINNLNIELLTRFKKNYDFYSNNNNVLLSYSDNSIAIIRNNNNL